MHSVSSHITFNKRFTKSEFKTQLIVLLMGKDLEPPALKSHFLDIAPMRHAKDDQPKTVMPNSYSEILLAFCFPEAIQHDFVIEIHTCSLE